MTEEARHRTMKNETIKKLSYKDMIIKSLLDLNEAEGSICQNILDYMCSKFEKIDNKAVRLGFNAGLKKGLKDGSFELVKGNGPHGVFKLCKATKTQSKSSESGKSKANKRDSLSCEVKRSERKVINFRRASPRKTRQKQEAAV